MQRKNRMQMFIFSVLMVLFIGAQFPVSAETFANTKNLAGGTPALRDSEPLDSWMPDGRLQTIVADMLKVDKSQLTKEFLASHYLSVDYQDDREFFYLSSYRGLEYLSAISIQLGMEANDGSSAYLTAHPINWNLLNVLENMRVYSFGDLRGVYPDGVNVKDDRIHIDPYNVYFANKIRLNQDNYRSFFLSYSELKLLSADPSDFTSLYVSTNDGPSYTATAVENGFQFTLSDDEAYSKLAGKSFVNTEEEFPDGPYMQIYFGHSILNLRLDLYFSVPGGDITVKYLDQDGVELAPPEILSGGVGEDYRTDQLDFAGYTLTGVIGNPSGQFTDLAQSVSFIYTKDAPVVVEPVPDPDPSPEPEEHPGFEPQPETDSKNPTSGSEKYPDSKNQNVVRVPGETQTAPVSTNKLLPKTGENDRISIAGIVLGAGLLSIILALSVRRLNCENRSG